MRFLKCYSASREKEILSVVTTWTAGEGIMLRETSQQIEVFSLMLEV